MKNYMGITVMYCKWWLSKLVVIKGLHIYYSIGKTQPNTYSECSQQTINYIGDKVTYLYSKDTSTDVEHGLIFHDSHKKFRWSIATKGIVDVRFNNRYSKLVTVELYDMENNDVKLYDYDGNLLSTIQLCNNYPDVRCTWSPDDELLAVLELSIPTPMGTLNKLTIYNHDGKHIITKYVSKSDRILHWC